MSFSAHNSHHKSNRNSMIIKNDTHNSHIVLEDPSDPKPSPASSSLQRSRSSNGSRSFLNRFQNTYCAIKIQLWVQRKKRILPLVSKNALVGECVVPIASFKKGGELDDWHPVHAYSKTGSCDSSGQISPASQGIGDDGSSSSNTLIRLKIAFMNAETIQKLTSEKEQQNKQDRIMGYMLELLKNISSSSSSSSSSSTKNVLSSSAASMSKTHPSALQRSNSEQDSEAVVYNAQFMLDSMKDFAKNEQIQLIGLQYLWKLLNNAKFGKARCCIIKELGGEEKVRDALSNFPKSSNIKEYGSLVLQRLSLGPAGTAE